MASTLIKPQYKGLLNMSIKDLEEEKEHTFDHEVCSWQPTGEEKHLTLKSKAVTRRDSAWRNELTADSQHTMRTNVKPCPSKPEPWGNKARAGKQLWAAGPGQQRAEPGPAVRLGRRVPAVPRVSWAGHIPESRGRTGTVPSAKCSSDHVSVPFQCPIVCSWCKKNLYELARLQGSPLRQWGWSPCPARRGCQTRAGPVSGRDSLEGTQQHPWHRWERMEETKLGSSQWCVAGEQGAAAQADTWEAQAGDREKPLRMKTAQRWNQDSGRFHSPWLSLWWFLPAWTTLPSCQTKQKFIC